MKNMKSGKKTVLSRMKAIAARITTFGGQEFLKYWRIEQVACAGRRSIARAHVKVVQRHH
ncbi:MAG TPA: hypothetical protein VFZ52_04365 [Chryseolinea sp.]